MDIASIVLNQLLIMAILIIVGILLGKLHLITYDGAKQLSNLLLNVVVPCVIFKSFLMEFDTTKLMEFACACAFAFLAHFLLIALVTFLYKKTNDDEYKIKRFATVFSNAGFMAIPIISAVLGDEGVFYASAFLIANNALSFSYGVFVLSSGNNNAFSTLKKTLLNPAILSVFAGFLVFITQLPLPKVFISATTFFEGMNTPLAMVIMGVYIFYSNIKKGFTNKRIYGIVVLRLLVAPLMMLLVFWGFGSLFPNFLNSKIILANLIAAACPCGIVTIILSAIHIKGSDHRDFALSCVVVTTILSLVSIPLMLYLSQLILHL